MSFDLRRQNKTIFGQSTEFLIGELLLKSGVIKQHQLDEALKLSGNKHMQIGQMLIMARYINQQDLQAALDAQIALRDRILDMNGAIRALSIAHRSKITFAEASQQQTKDTGLLPSHKLGQLLLEANLISPEQLSVAVQKSMATGLPVGRILILNNVITEPILAGALEILIKMRDGNVIREEAVAYLANAVRSKEFNDLGVASLEEASVFNSQPVLSTRKSIRLGEFLVLAEILSETDVMNALEFSLVAEKTLGEALLEHGYVTRELMDSALKLQSLVDSDTLDSMKAAQALSLIHVNAIPLTEALDQVTSAVPDGSQLEFSALLIDSQLITVDDIRTALDLAASNPRILGQILSQTGYLSTDQAEVLVECHEAITQNLISQHDAKFVLDFCLQKLADGRITFAEGLHELGWSRSDEVEDVPEESPPPPEQTAATERTAAPERMVAPAVDYSKGANVKVPVQSSNVQGSFLGTALPGASNQSFIDNSNNNVNNPITDSPTVTAPQKPTGAAPQNRKERRSGRTTSNMPAITNIQAGSELHLTAAEKSAINESPKADSFTRSGDHTLSLKSLLKDNYSELPEDNVSESKPPANGNKKAEDLFELSESEKALIIKASSLTASPQEIMAAMKLAAKKERAIQSQDKNKDEEDK